MRRSKEKAKCLMVRMFGDEDEGVQEFKGLELNFSLSFLLANVEDINEGYFRV